MKKIFYIILGGIIFSTITVLAASTLSSNEVFYKRVNNQDMTVQQALDDLYTKATSSSCPEGNYCISNDDFGTPEYYAFGTYKGWCSGTDTSCNSYANFPTTETSAPTGKNVYAAKYADGQYGVCIIRNGTEHCFRARNYIAESKHIQEVFSDISCYVSTYGTVECDASDFVCNVNPQGSVFCGDYDSENTCDVYVNGSVECS